MDLVLWRRAYPFNKKLSPFFTHSRTLLFFSVFGLLSVNEENFKRPPHKSFNKLTKYFRTPFKLWFGLWVILSSANVINTGEGSSYMKSRKMRSIVISLALVQLLCNPVETFLSITHPEKSAGIFLLDFL